jgi:hypothetical protein
MRLAAIFETWHLGDGTYPPFDLRQSKRLSFEIGDARVERCSERTSAFISNDDSTCEFSGVVLGRYDDLTALEAGGFRFYVNGPEADEFDRGAHLRGSGTLALDHYAWFENVSSFVDPPDLFFESIVLRIRKVRIPERFVHRQAQGKSYPTWVAPGEYSNADVEDLVTMKGQSFDEAFCLLDLDVPAIAGGAG